MKITLIKDLERKTEALFLGLFEEDKDNYRAYNKELAEEIEVALKEKKFSKKFGEIYSTKIAALPFKKVIIMGLGKKQDFTLEKVRQSLGKAVNYVKCCKFVSFSTNLTALACSLNRFEQELLGRAVAEGLVLADYDFIKYLSIEKKEKRKAIDNVFVQWNAQEALLSRGLNVGKLIAENTNFVRDLVNEPASVVNSEYLELVARKIATGSTGGSTGSGKIKLKVLNKTELQKEGMNALLGVNAGSENAPKLLLLEYKCSGGQSRKEERREGREEGRKEERGGKKCIVLVGKGITFDSGGYNLKPTKFIEDMKTDMAGGAAVLGVIKTAAELGLKADLVGVIPVCENMVSGSAQHPGDIVRAYNGKTIEIGNTDAEGRLILADALAYAEKKYAPASIIDLATLTGACVVALGYYAAGMVGNDEQLLGKLSQAGMESGDRVWPLPFFEEYQDWMDGTISDLNNASLKGKGYEAGPVTGGVFLNKFIERAKWVHVDIAGSAYWYVDGAYLQKGATGSGVRFLMYYLLKNC
ncbi:MAG: leucyl aminopeptidase [Nanoarchaeota archaeon]